MVPRQLQGLGKVQRLVAPTGARLSKLVPRYALRDMKKPIGVSEYKLTEVVPRGLKGKLPTVKQLEEEMEGNLLRKQNHVSRLVKKRKA